ncbi:uncharacterized protein [Triticum aestivum]|uniref:uncharacterized protein isoform X1 n=1 Tax=Triticum aestivum TaxID=4565 RepID=UPI001D00AE70|nr:uncharacterized protein LOC123103081 isoform X1 [Triticum aestivum]
MNPNPSSSPRRRRLLRPARLPAPPPSRSSPRGLPPRPARGCRGARGGAADPRRPGNAGARGAALAAVLPGDDDDPATDGAGRLPTVFLLGLLVGAAVLAEALQIPADQATLALGALAAVLPGDNDDPATDGARRLPAPICLLRAGQLRPSWRPTCPLRPKSPCPGPARYMVLNIQPRRGGASSPACAYHPQRQHRKANTPPWLNLQCHYNSTKV